MLKHLPIVGIVMALALAGLAAALDAQSYSADYSVINDAASVRVAIVLNGPVSVFEWNLPEDATDVLVDGLGFKVIDLKSFKRLQVQAGQPFDAVNFTYSTSSVLEKTRDSFFILDLAGSSAVVKSVTVRLPEGATLKYSLDSPQASVIPKTGSIRTDGKRIIISWDDKSLAGGTAILVIYKEASHSNPAVVAAATGILLLVGVVVSFYRRKKAGVAVAEVGKKAAVETSDLTRNLFEDERKVVEILIGAGDDGLWQKQLEIRSGLSKVKLSRKLRSLEQKGLIEKIPYGNANKIRLKKG